MKCIILKKKVFKEVDLQLHCLTSDGQIIQVLFPGIVKSKKRNSYYLQPGCIFEFTITRVQDHKNNIPSEYQLLASPFVEELSYSNLVQISELMAATRFLVAGEEYTDIFLFLEKIIESWQDLNANQCQWLINSFYILILTNMGIFAETESCNQCEKKLNKSDFYILGEGNYCQSCAQSFENQLPYAFFSYYSQNFNPWVKRAVTLRHFTENLEFNFETAIKSPTFKNSKHIIKSLDQYLEHSI